MRPEREPRTGALEKVWMPPQVLFVEVLKARIRGEPTVPRPVIG